MWVQHFAPELNISGLGEMHLQQSQDVWVVHLKSCFWLCLAESTVYRHCFLFGKPTRTTQIKPGRPPHLTETKGLLHTSTLLQQFMMSFSPFMFPITSVCQACFFFIIFPWLPEGTSLLKWMAVFAQGRVGLSVLWTWMVIPSRCWLIAGCLVIRLGNSLLWATRVLSHPDTVVCRIIQVSNVAGVSENR